MTTTDWKKVLEDNREEIETKMVEIYEAWEGKSTDIHEAVAIEPSGKLYTWEYVGDFSGPIEVWNGTDFHITTFTGWSWDDGDVNWKDAGNYHARTPEEKEAIQKRFDEEDEKGTWGKSEYQILDEEFHEVFELIKETSIDYILEVYQRQVSELLDEIISQVS